MIIYIHGFGSSGMGVKASLFRKYFEEKHIPYIAPSLSYVPILAMETLEALIASYEDVALIGSSLGGYYAVYLAEKYGLKAVLINPAVSSAKTLAEIASKEGWALNYYDGSRFEWLLSHIEMLQQFAVEQPQKSTYLLMLQKGDEVLDYREALEKFPHSKLILEEGGNHSFSDIEVHFETIEHFLR